LKPTKKNAIVSRQLLLSLSFVILMEPNGLKQSDLIDVFGSASIVSEVLKAEPPLSRFAGNLFPDNN